MNQVELTVLNWIQEHLRCDFLDTVMPIITRFGDEGIFWIIVAVILICIPKTRKAGLSMGLAMLMGWIVGNMILKNAVARIRPYDVQEGINLLIDRLSSYSFPSGHTLVCFEAATALTMRYRKWGIAALVLAALVAFSRMYLFVHYPTDVLGGAVLGIAFGIFASKLIDLVYTKIEKRRNKAK
ncbi:MAG: phosphatase PAP2 family protein [Clostridia bacterium]|nr:phosphatase PAP2 family protein [Clostridia bacterium]